MDHTTRNMTIRALAAATAAEIRMNPAKAVRAHTNPLRAEASGEIRTFGPYLRGGYPAHTTRTGSMLAVESVEQPPRRTTERELPLERTPNHYTSEHRDEVVR